MAATVRMSGQDRRRQIIDAALPLFAEGGYSGMTTDQVARAAGVSQPYVIRLFGSKRELILAIYRDVVERVISALTAVESGPDAEIQMGDAYVTLMGDRNLLRAMMQGFIAGTDPEIGELARTTLSEAFRIYLERATDGDPEERRVRAGNFLATGMLINVLLAVDAPTHLRDDPALADLVGCVIGRTTQEQAAGIMRGTWGDATG